MPLITMTREMGSGGRDVAIGLAEALEIDIVHYQVVEQHVANRMNVDAGAVHRYLEGGDNPLERWRMHRNGVDRCTAQELYRLALRGNVLIRGWGATHLLRAVPHAISVRVCAPMERRIETLMERVGLTSEDDARKEIRANDAAHARVSSRYSRTDWRDPLNFDVVLNTDRLATDECVGQIMRIVALKEFQETPESRAILTALSNQLTAPGTSREQAAGRRRNFDDQPVLREERDFF